VPMLTANDVADLYDMVLDTQTAHSLTLRRTDVNGTHTTLAPQSVQVAYAARQPLTGGLTGTAQTLTGLAFYGPSDFNVRVGDKFILDGHTGGTIRRVIPDPVLGVVIAEADLDTGR
jgi:hypothetical protein